jgi:hypothetical protein
MSYRTDEISRTNLESEAEALARLRAEQAARRVLDREAAARDANERWAAREAPKARPAGAVGVQQAAQQAMVRRTSPGWTLEPQPDVARASAAWRMDAARAASGIRSAAEARQAMQQRIVRVGRGR